MENVKIKITTPKQFERLVELMEEYPHLATGFYKSVQKFNVKDEWNKLAGKINFLGPPTRTGEGWKKVWEDYKFKLRKKLIHNKAECGATGGGPFKKFVLSPTDEAAASLLQLNSLINPGESIGVQKIRGVSKESEHIFEKDASLNENYTPSTSTYVQSTKESQNNECTMESEKPTYSKYVRSPKEALKSKNDLLSEQLKLQTNLYMEVKQSFKEIERYNRKRFKIEEEKLKLYKEELMEKKEYRNSLYRLRKEEIEIEKRKLELEELKSGLNE